MDKKEVRCCVKCKKKSRLERHHVLYKPPILVDLCHSCHRAITFINTQVALMYKTDKKKKVKFTNVVRMGVWLKFLEKI